MSKWYVSVVCRKEWLPIKKRKGLLMTAGALALSLVMGGSALARPVAPVASAGLPIAPPSAEVPGSGLQPDISGLPNGEEAFSFRTDALSSEEMPAHLKEKLNALVAAGKLTQEEADALYKAAKEGGPPFPGKFHGPINREQMLADLKTHLDEQVAAGELTQEEADALYKAAEEHKRPEKPDGFENKHPRHGNRDCENSFTQDMAL